MKRIFVLLILLLTSITLLSTQADAALTENLTHFWQFDEGAGTTGYDNITTSSINMSVSNWSSIGLFGKSAMNNLSTNRVTFPSTSTTLGFTSATGPQTFNFWFYIVNVSSNYFCASNRKLALYGSSYPATYSSLRWDIYMDASCGVNVEGFGGSNYYIASGNDIRIRGLKNGWNMMTMIQNTTYGANATNNRFYILLNANFSLVGNDRFNANVSYAIGQAGSSSGVLALGNNDGSQMGDAIMFDDVAIWNRALSFSEVTTLYNNRTGCANLTCDLSGGTAPVMQAVNFTNTTSPMYGDRVIGCNATFYDAESSALNVSITWWQNISGTVTRNTTYDCSFLDTVVAVNRTFVSNSTCGKFTGQKYANNSYICQVTINDTVGSSALNSTWLNIDANNTPTAPAMQTVMMTNLTTPLYGDVNFGCNATFYDLDSSVVTVNLTWWQNLSGTVTRNTTYDCLFVENTSAVNRTIYSNSTCGKFLGDKYENNSYLCQIIINDSVGSSFLNSTWATIFENTTPIYTTPIISIHAGESGGGSGGGSTDQKLASSGCTGPGSACTASSQCCSGYVCLNFFCQSETMLIPNTTYQGVNSTIQLYTPINRSSIIHCISKDSFVARISDNCSIVNNTYCEDGETPTTPDCLVTLDSVLCDGDRCIFEEMWFSKLVIIIMLFMVLTYDPRKMYWLLFLSVFLLIAHSPVQLTGDELIPNTGPVYTQSAQHANVVYVLGSYIWPTKPIFGFFILLAIVFYIINLLFRPTTRRNK